MRSVVNSFNCNEVKIVRNVFSSARYVWALISAAFIALTTLTQAQFYVGQGASGLVGKVTTAGAPSTFFTGTTGNAEGVTTDSSGNLFAAVGTSIYQITPGGTSSLYGNYANTIGGLSMSSTGVLYGVSTAGGPLGGHDVGIYGAGGSFTSLTLTNPGFVPFYPSNGLKFDSTGNLFVTNPANGGTYG